MDLASNTDQMLQQSIEGLAGGGAGSSSSADFPIFSFIRALPQLFPSLHVPHSSCPGSRPCSPWFGISLLPARLPELPAGLDGAAGAQIPGFGLERCCSAIFSREGSTRGGVRWGGGKNPPQSPPRPRDTGNIPGWSGWNRTWIQPKDGAGSSSEPLEGSIPSLRAAARRLRDPAALNSSRALWRAHPASPSALWICWAGNHRVGLSSSRRAGEHEIIPMAPGGDGAG